MAKYPESSNPFLDDEDEDNGFSSPYTSNQRYGGPSNRMSQKQEMISASEDRQLESSKRALASLYESERMGVATAEELLRQGEQLDNIDRKTTQMTQTTKTAQKHLNNIKSVFGGIKNWWQGKKEEQEPKALEPRESKLKNTMESRKDTPAGQHPALKLRSEDYKGFYEEDDDLDKRFMAGSRQNCGNQQYITSITKSDKEERLNENLGELSHGISRLKDLAIGLGDEIELQNEKLDVINPKMDILNERLEGQNRQMKGILRK